MSPAVYFTAYKAPSNCSATSPSCFRGTMEEGGGCPCVYVYVRVLMARARVYVHARVFMARACVYVHARVFMARTCV